MIAGGNDQPLLIGRERRADAESLIILVIQFDILSTGWPSQCRRALSVRQFSLASE
jgi:hypothetical protein